MYLTSLLALALVQSPAIQDDAFGVEVFEYLERLHSRGFAGVVLVKEGDERLLAEGFGFANREKEIPWTTATHSTVGSIAKQFTAAAVMKLVETKKLSVEDPLGKFFADAPADKREIELHQLLTHSAGFGELELRDNDWISRDDLVQTALEAPLLFEPGTRYEYSNVGYSLLAAIVELVSGKGYEAFLAEELFRPAGMSETGFLLPKYDPGRMAVGYHGEERWGTMREDMYFDEGPSWVLVGNGGMYSTAEEMARWVDALAKHRVLSKESVEKLWTPYVDESNGAKASFYGYGWAIYDTPDGTQVIWHNGGDGMGSFFNDLAWVPEHELFVFMQTNDRISTPEAEDIVARIVRRFVAGTPLPE